MNCMSKFCVDPVLEYIQVNPEFLDKIFYEAEKAIYISKEREPEVNNQLYKYKGRNETYATTLKAREHPKHSLTKIKEMTNIDLFIEKMQRFSKYSYVKNGILLNNMKQNIL